MLNQLVREIILNVLLFLPWKVILRLRMVSRAWNNIFFSNYFLKNIFLRDYPQKNFFYSDNDNMTILDYIKMKKKKIFLKYIVNVQRQKRFRHTSTLYKDYIIIIGGDNDRTLRERFLLKYNIKSRTMVKILNDQKPIEISRHTSVLYNDTIFIFGGFIDNIPSNRLFKYKIEENLWEEILPNNQSPEAPPILFNHQSLIFNHQMWVLNGNIDVDGSFTNRIYIYDIATSYWNLIETFGDKPLPNYGANITLVNDKFVMIGGDFPSCNRYHNDYKSKVYILDPISKYWKSVLTHGYPSCSRFLSAVNYENFLYVFGGSNCSKTRTYSSWRFDLIELNWKEEKIDINGDSMNAVVFENQIILTFGYFIRPINTIKHIFIQ